MPTSPKKSAAASRKKSSPPSSRRTKRTIQNSNHNSFQRVWKWVHDFFHAKPLLGYVGLTVVLMVIIFLAEQTTYFFKASILEAQVQFDGTSWFAKEVPNWPQTGGKNDKPYAQYAKSELVALPAYNPQDFLSNSTDDATRIAQITYSVPYAGSYQLGAGEGAGSHPAVDVRLPTGTPLYAVANAIVEKAVEQNTGFGYYVMLKVPRAVLDGKTKTLYITYAHLSQVAVKAGQIVQKGQQIGLVGDTGTATTPHVHLQCDEESAPFKPYWPFTSADAVAAGLSFFEAINSGLGRENVQKHTCNPLEFVQQNLQYRSGGGNTNINTTNTNPPETTHTAAPTLDDFEIIATPSEVFSGETITLTITALDDDEQTLTNFIADTTFTISDRDISTPKLTFQNGVATTMVTAVNAGRVKFTVQSGNAKESMRVTVTKKQTGTHNAANENNSDPEQNMNHVSAFQVESDRKFVVNTPETITIKTIDADGHLTMAPFHGTARITFEEGTGTVNPNELSTHDFQNGIVTVELVATAADDVELKVQNGALVGISKDIRSDRTLVFSDVKTTDPYGPAIVYLKNAGVLNGNPDGSFQPHTDINRAAVVKILIEGFEKAVQSGNPGFSDVANDAWFKDYVYTAVEDNIVNGYADGTFGPEKPMLRSEFFKVLLEIDQAALTAQIETDPCLDVTKQEWYAKYMLYAKDNALLDFGTNCNPGAKIQRWEVAEAMYRLLQ